MKQTFKVSRTSRKIVEITVEIPDEELDNYLVGRMNQFKKKALEKAGDTDFSNGRDYGEPEYKVIDPLPLQSYR